MLLLVGLWHNLHFTCGISFVENCDSVLNSAVSMCFCDYYTWSRWCVAYCRMGLQLLPMVSEKLEITIIITEH